MVLCQVAPRSTTQDLAHRFAVNAKVSSDFRWGRSDSSHRASFSGSMLGRQGQFLAALAPVPSTVIL